MIKARIQKTIVLILLSFLTTGCWDRTELNDQALVMASGVDLSNSGGVLLTDQVVFPINLAKGLGSTSQQFITVSATGRNILDAGQSLQTKLSRKYFLGHRRIIFVGEQLAKRGLGDMMDEFTRNPDVRLRSDMFVVKGGTAANALQLKAPLEQYPALSIIKSRKFVGGKIGTTLLSFLMASASDTSGPTLPVLEIVEESPGSDKQTFQFTGRAVFNKHLKLLGYLNYSEANYRFWVINTISSRQVTFHVDGQKGFSTIDFSQFGSRIVPRFTNGQLRYTVTLRGQGILRESETNVDFKKPGTLNVLEKSADEEVTNKVTQLIAKVQREYGVDVFGFDMALARKYPHQWQKMKSHWDEIFPRIPVEVNTNVRIKVVGLTSESVVSPQGPKLGGSW